jgi:hypothetical protein
MQSISLALENEDIVFADVINREKLEVIIVCKSGNIFLFDCETGTKTLINQLDFDPAKVNLQIYSFQDYVCIVQKKGTDGIVINLSNAHYRKDLLRGDYCVNVSPFPIAFYSDQGQTFLIHGTDWNRLDITCLETDELLTNRLVDYDTDSNYFDYFHGSLYVSPDSKFFISSGWVWQPYEVITLYSIGDFLKNFELLNQSIDFEETSGYNWGRPICWIDNETFAVSYNKKEAVENEGNFPSEIIFVDVFENKVVNRINFNGFSLSDYGEVGGELFFDSDKKQFIGLNKQSGLLISDVKGKEIFRNPNLTSRRYSPKHRIFYRIDFKKQLLEIID